MSNYFNQYDHDHPKFISAWEAFHHLRTILSEKERFDYDLENQYEKIWSKINTPHRIISIIYLSYRHRIVITTETKSQKLTKYFQEVYLLKHPFVYPYTFHYSDPCLIFESFQPEKDLIYFESFFNPSYYKDFTLYSIFK